MDNEQSFQCEIARSYGLVEAVVLERLYLWSKHNQEAGLGLVEGKVWIFKPLKLFLEEMDYISEYLLKTALCRLRDAGLLLIANGEQKPHQPREKMVWFALTQEGWGVEQRYKGQQLRGDFNPYLYWEQNLGPGLNQLMAEDISELVDAVGVDIYKQALQEARRHNVRSFSYVKKVAENMKNGISFHKGLPF